MLQIFFLNWAGNFLHILTPYKLRGKDTTPVLDYQSETWMNLGKLKQHLLRVCVWEQQ